MIHIEFNVVYLQCVLAFLAGISLCVHIDEDAFPYWAICLALAACVVPFFV